MLLSITTGFLSVLPRVVAVVVLGIADFGSWSAEVTGGTDGAAVTMERSSSDELSPY